MNDNDQPESAYQLTLKGLLAARLNGNMPLVEALYSDIEQYARKILDHNEERGIPAIILQNGGSFVAVGREKES